MWTILHLKSVSIIVSFSMWRAADEVKPWRRVKHGIFTVSFKLASHLTSWKVWDAGSSHCWGLWRETVCAAQAARKTATRPSIIVAASRLFDRSTLLRQPRWWWASLLNIVFTRSWWLPVLSQPCGSVGDVSPSLEVQSASGILKLVSREGLRVGWMGRSKLISSRVHFSGWTRLDRVNVWG